MRPARASRRLAVAGARDGEVEGHRQEREGGVGHQRAAPAEPLAERVADRPEHGRREPAEERDLRHRPPGLGSADPRERREGRLVERETHPDAEAHPRGVVEREVMGHRDADAAQRVEERARRHRRAPAEAVDRAAGDGRAHPRHDQREGQAAVRDRTAPAEVGGDRFAEDGDQMIGDAPRHELRHAQARHGPARDHGGTSLGASEVAADHAVRSARPQTFRSRGSRKSRRLSPTMLNAIVRLRIASPGNVAIHHWSR